jgi:DNA-binding XRE family transcriptional regulator
MQGADPVREVQLAVQPLAVLSRTFPARPSSIPDIRDFVQESLAEAPLSPEMSRELQSAVNQALLDAASPSGSIQISFRMFPDSIEVDVLRSVAPGEYPPEWSADPSFSDWIASVLKREHLTHEAAAQQLGVSVKTVSRWLHGESKPRMRHLRRMVEVFGETPPS